MAQENTKEGEDPPSLRPEGVALRAKIEMILSRGEPRSVVEIARNLVVPPAEVAYEVTALQNLGARGEGRPLTRDDTGRYVML
jgi:hypothetical protein